MTRHYCTTASAAYLTRLKVLVASMRRHCRPFRLHVLAEGDEVTNWCRAQDDVPVTRVEAFLAMHHDLKPENLPGRPRTGNELACCWRWSYALDILETYGEPVVAIDADLMFFGDPDPVFEETPGRAVSVLPHAFPPAARGLPGVTQESHGRYGRFNGGFSVWSDPAALALMARLTVECSHASDHLWPDGRVTWGDQGALQLVDDAIGAHVIENPAAAPGPWCAHNHPLRQAHDGTVFFGGQRLIAWHFHAFKGRPDGTIERFSYPDYALTAEQARILGEPYAAALAAAEG